MFSGCTVPPDSTETELGSSNQEASPSTRKNTGVVRHGSFKLPCHAWKSVSNASSGDMDISEVSGRHLLQKMSSQ